MTRSRINCIFSKITFDVFSELAKCKNKHIPTLDTKINSYGPSSTLESYSSPWHLWYTLLPAVYIKITSNVEQARIKDKKIDNWAIALAGNFRKTVKDNKKFKDVGYSNLLHSVQEWDKNYLKDRVEKILTLFVTLL